MLGWSFFALCNSSLSRSIFYMKLGPSKQVWVGRPRGHQCVPMGRGWWWWWLSFLLSFTILFIYSSEGVSISTSIIKYWSYWLLLASFWLFFFIIAMIRIGFSMMRSFRMMNVPGFSTCCHMCFIGLITHHHLGVEALLPDILSGWWIIRMCQTQPQWELKGAPHNAALPGASRRYWGII